MSEKIDELTKRVATLERENDELRTQRRTAVTGIKNSRITHQDTATAFHTRTANLDDDDLEGALVAWGIAVNDQVYVLLLCH